MKFVRYGFIALFLYYLLASIHGMISPSLIYGVPGGEEIHDVSKTTEEIGIRIYRKMMAPYLAFYLLGFFGWVFLSRKPIVFTIAGFSLLALFAILYLTLRPLGYTLTQVQSAISLGLMNEMMTHIFFHFAAVILLLVCAFIPTRTRSHEQTLPVGVA